MSDLHPYQETRTYQSDCMIHSEPTRRERHHVPCGIHSIQAMERLCCYGHNQLTSPQALSYIEEPPSVSQENLRITMSPDIQTFEMENAAPNFPNAAVGLSQAESEQLGDAFRLLDTQHKGVISVFELRQVLEAVVQESKATPGSTTTKNMNCVLAALEQRPDDENLTLDAFIGLITAPDPNDNRDEMKRVFDMFDVDQKGFINRQDLQNIASDLGETMADDELEEMIQRASSTDSGKVTLTEFTDIMTRKLFS
jgi:Ca2+-binding EF-hand superfamily protein